ncbi:MAG: sugar phosphate isomerase/epimerase [Clostridiales Family XIII bacterium]|jgi:sugar phosphate isomerase/epimerase|nr:sugar phosphate isomerase/epimerase [Clostridiales Family XIII bacterium]
MNTMKFAVASADAAPPTAPILLTGDVLENLKTAARLGYDAVEIHTEEDVDWDCRNILSAAEESNVSVAAIVTGRLNTRDRVSLTDDRPDVSQAALDGLLRYTEMAKALRTDIIIGWAKGKIPEGRDKRPYLDRLAKQLKIIGRVAEANGVKVHLEAINRYETNIFNTAKETADFLAEYELPGCDIHLDTFHMGIEEADPYRAISEAGRLLGYFHVADNTRGCPGSGCFDFERILIALGKVDYRGFVSVECLPGSDGEETARRAIAHLKQSLKKRR